MPSDNKSDHIVVKVGGSLYDLPDLGPRLCRWLAKQDARFVLLVPGGGALADAVRKLDAAHRLGEETAHWLALRSLTVNAHFLAALLPGAVVVGHPENWQGGTIAVLDPHSFALADEGTSGALPRSWAVTSDSIAARAARVAGIRRLVLLKSITIPCETDWNEAARRGWVDEYFATAISDELETHVVTLRGYT